MILIHYYIWYLIYRYRMSCTFDAFDVDSGEEFPPLPPLGDYCCFVGVHLNLSTSSCTVCAEGVIVLALDYY